MASAFVLQVIGTIVLWTLSAATAAALAVVVAALSLHRRRFVRGPAEAFITLTRGIPTSLLVVSAGIAALPHAPPSWLPNPFPGTSPGLAGVAWAVTLALALGSTGHLAVILRTGYLALGTPRMEQATVLGLRGTARLRLLARESAPATLAPLGARLVHHLHNTGFAALFPVADLFGWIQQRAHETFDVSRYVAIGVGTYVILSLLIWAGFRGLEHWLRTPVPLSRATRPRVAA